MLEKHYNNLFSERNRTSIKGIAFLDKESSKYGNSYVGFEMCLKNATEIFFSERKRTSIEGIAFLGKEPSKYGNSYVGFEMCSKNATGILFSGQKRTSG